MEPDKVTTSAVIQDLMCARQQKKDAIYVTDNRCFFLKKKKTYQQLPFVYVHSSANIQFMFMLTNKTRKEWVLKTCGSLVARQPWRSALEDLELSPIILKASIKLVWTHWCRLAVQCVAETDDRKTFDIIQPSFSMSVNTCVISLQM